MNFKKYKGSSTVEYAIVLACICSLGFAFTSDGLSKPLNGIMDRIVAILDLGESNGGNLLAGNYSTQKGYFDNGFFKEYNRKMVITDADGKLFALKPGADYEITIDLSKLQAISEMTDADMEHTQLGIFAWDTNTYGTTPWLDSGDMSFVTSNPVHNRLYAVPGTPYDYKFSITPTLSADGKTMTYSFTSGNVESYASLVLNFNGVLQEQDKMNKVSPKLSEIVSLHQAN